MGASQADKARTRTRILDEAAARIRAHGLESLSVASLMQAVDLTHGGFYKHFASRADLQVEALRAALESGAANAAERPDAAPTQEALPAFRRFVRGYLSRSHRDHPETGCAIAALAADTARAELPLREVMAESVDTLIAAAARALGDVDTARLAVSAMVGALVLARVAPDPRDAEALLRSVRGAIARLEPAAEAEEQRR